MKFNNITITHPDLIEEWHPSKNGDRKPGDFSYGSDKKVWWLCKKDPRHEWDAMISNRARLGRGCPYCGRRRVLPEESFGALYPEKAKEWHPTKNGDLTPWDVSYGSHKKVWWLCSKNPQHAWEAMIKDRTLKGIGCRDCSGRRPTTENNLEVHFPEIAKEWHPTLNGELKPKLILPHSGKKVWWLCSKNPKHEWEAIIYNRTGSKKKGCHYCGGRMVLPEESLAALYPEIAKEWHPAKNKGKTPWEMAPKSGKKVWWLCSKNPRHEWESKIDNRTIGDNSCRFCGGKEVLAEESFGA